MAETFCCGRTSIRLSFYAASGCVNEQSLLGRRPRCAANADRIVIREASKDLPPLTAAVFLPPKESKRHSCPLFLFGPGTAQCSQAYTTLLEGIAKEGYVVVVPDTNQSAQVARGARVWFAQAAREAKAKLLGKGASFSTRIGSSATLEMSMKASLQKQYMDDLEEAARYLLKEDTKLGDIHEWLLPRADLYITAAGHSWGGAAVLGFARNWHINGSGSIQVKAVVGAAPVFSEVFSELTAKSILPALSYASFSLLLCGTLDRLAKPETVKESFDHFDGHFLEGVTPPAAYIELENATHEFFASSVHFFQLKLWAGPLERACQDLHQWWYHHQSSCLRLTNEVQVQHFRTITCHWLELVRQQKARWARTDPYYEREWPGLYVKSRSFDAWLPIKK